mmetsp:Transcript_11614/g.20644  ORF Transcript_11614/g.20644 Transcript_11614/m.20644 type:complete len:182 (+) Transcript_11614:64-609(+)
MSLYMITITALLGSMGTVRQTQIALIVAHTWSRLTSQWLVKLFPYIHDEGDDKGLLYNTFAGCLEAGLLTWKRVWASTAYTFLIAALLLEAHYVAILAIAFPILVMAAGSYACGVIGGVIGDYLGAVIMLSELAVHLLLSAELPGDSSELVRPWIAVAIVAGIPALMMRGAGDIPDVDKEC